MNDIMNFLDIFPKEIKMLYVKDLIRNSGKISDDTWQNMLAFLNKECREIENYKIIIRKVLKEFPMEEQAEIKAELTKFEELEVEELIDLEDVLRFDKAVVRRILFEYDKTELVKATYVVSPDVVNYFQSIFHGVDFKKIRNEIGAISVDEAMNASTKVVEYLNDSLGRI